MTARPSQRRRKRGNVPTPAPPSRLLPLWLLLFVGIVAAYWPSFSIPYLFDDHDAIENNPFLRDPSSLGWLFRVPENSTLIARPFLSWTFGLNALFFGHHPSSYHFFNLLVHLGNVALVAAIARRRWPTPATKVRVATA